MKQRKKGMQDMHDVTRNEGANELSDDDLNDVVGGWTIKCGSSDFSFTFNADEARRLCAQGYNVEAGVEYNSARFYGMGLSPQKLRNLLK